MTGLLSASARRRRLFAAIAAAAIALPVAVPSLAAHASSPATTIVRASVARPGEYLVLVSFPDVTANGTATVSIDPQHQATIPLIAPSPTAVEFFVKLASTAFQVRAVSAGPPLHFTVTTSRASTPSSADSQSPAGATGVTAITNPYHPLKVFTAPASGSYDKLVWADEFTGRAGTAPNPVNWTLDRGGSCGAGTLSSSTQAPANASLDGHGALDIRALAGASGYTAAQIDTDYKFSFKYGRIEARIQQPPGQGLCSAFWLLGDGATPTSPPCWPGCGEIDVMEMVGQIPTQVDAFMHGPFPSDPNANSQQWGAEVNSPVALTGAYHTYGVIWRPRSITWTIDGIPYAQVTPAELPAGAKWVYDQHAAHIVLDLEVGGWPGAPSASTAFPATLRVDWVRVYQ
jgi:beta-glucanase (GH16 family)